MAGSLKYLVYADDDGNEWFYLADESNIENVLVDDTIADYELTDESSVVHQLPANIKPRTATYNSTTTTSTRTMIVPTSAVYSALRTNDSTVALKTFSDGSGETFKLKRLTPERISLPTAADSGLDDGDVT